MFPDGGSGVVNFEVFTPCDFIAAITQHILDKSFQLVRYYGWYSNKMRGRRAGNDPAFETSCGLRPAASEWTPSSCSP